MQTTKIKQAENYFFYLVVVLNLYPIVSTKFVPTMDGGAHLYNSNLISNLLFNGKQIASDYFMFNPEPVPNWAGHFILTILRLFLPGFLTEKIFLLFYAIALPVSFRNLIKTISPGNYFLCYIIFPFTYSLLFFLGFYNFFIAFVFMFMTLNYWIRKQDQLSSPKVLISLFLLISFTYFSHIMVFGVLLLLMALYTTLLGYTQWIENKSSLSDVIILALQKAGWLLLSSSLPLVLFYYYFHSREPTGEIYYLSKTELVNYIKTYKPLLTFDSAEEVYATKIFYVTVVLLVAAFYHKITSVIVEHSITARNKALHFFKSIIALNDFVLFAAIILLVLYFTVADSDGFAGFVSVRFCLLFLMILSAWLAVQHYNKWLQAAAIIAVLILNFGLIYTRNSSVKELSKIAVAVNDASPYIKPNSVVLPVKYSGSWFCGHFSNYMGADKPMVILENYECALGWFPLLWNKKSLPNTLLAYSPGSNYPCLKWKSNETNRIVNIDYVFVLGDVNSKNDSCSLRLKQLLTDSFSLDYSSEYCSLYKTKK